MRSGPEAFNIEIAGQMAAWFLGKVPGRSVSGPKLMKLLYLAERSFIERYGYPTLGDRLVSTPEGPILEGTLRHMKGRGTSNNGWNAWVSPVRNREVSPAREHGPEDLDLLSDVNLEVLAEVWNRFGGMNLSEISDHIRRNCPECENPTDSPFEITYEKLLTVLGYSEEKAKEDAAEFEARREIRRTFYS